VDEGRWNPKESFECGTKKKTPKRKAEIKVGTLGSDVIQKK
jgi:hypothetical protein